MQNKKYIKIISGILIILTIFSFSVVFSAYESVYVWSNQSKPITKQTSAKPNGNEQTKTTTGTEKSDDLKLESGGAVLIEQHSGQVLYDHNMHEKLRPASVTKVMSILLIMEAIDRGQISFNDKVPCTEDAAAMGGSQIWLDLREELTVDEMLKAICVVSANDCVMALSEYLGGTEEGFVQMMNNRAKELGMNDTTFKNCHGLDEDEHLTSAHDIALMSRELLMNHPSITNYSTIWTDTLRDGKSALSNTNKLVRNYAGCTGLKTGSTSLALFNLSASATRDGLSLIAVIMKAPTSALRFSNATSLLDYGFNNYSYKSFGNQGETIKQIAVNKGLSETVNAVYETSPSFLIKKGEEAGITYEISLDESVQAPISQGQILGTIKYSLNGIELGNVNIVAESTVEKIQLLNMTKHIIINWFTLLRI